MQLLGYLLVVIGTAWMMMCFLGTAMISPSIDMYTEALFAIGPRFFTRRCGRRAYCSAVVRAKTARVNRRG